ncbi:MAG: hypothetical protein ACR2M0_13965 [Chloroflexia bacterium]
MARNEKHTSPKAADDAADVLGDGRTGKASKSAAGSALSQAGGGGQQKHTSPTAAEAASAVLQDADTGKKSKSAAGSALAQAPAKKDQQSGGKKQAGG